MNNLINQKTSLHHLFSSRNPRAIQSLIRKLKLYIFPAGQIVQKIQALPCMRRHHLKGIFFQTSSVAGVQCVCVLRPFAKVFLSHIWCKTSVDNDMPSCLSNIMDLVRACCLIHLNSDSCESIFVHLPEIQSVKEGLLIFLTSASRSCKKLWF